jgi:hypothetical protein
MIRTCSALLSELGIEGAIRVGDIFALLVEWFASQRDYQQVRRAQGRARRVGAARTTARRRAAPIDRSHPAPLPSLPPLRPAGCARACVGAGVRDD